MSDLRYFFLQLFILFSLILKTDYSISPQAAQLKKDEGIFISQIQVEEKTSFFKYFAQQSNAAAKLLVEEKNNLANIENDNSLTEEQKKHETGRMKNKIALYEKFITQTPRDLDSSFLVSSLEYGLTDKASIGCKALYKQSKILNKGNKRLLEFEVFNSFEVYKSKKVSIAISPRLLFSQNDQVNPELRIIFSRSKQKKKYGLFHELQFAARSGPHYAKYLMDVTNGIKFNNGFLIFLQHFLHLEPQNPMIIYKSSKKSQISIAKQMKNKTITLQASYFMHTATKANKLIGTGFVAGIWIKI